MQHQTHVRVPGQLIVTKDAWADPRAHSSWDPIAANNSVALQSAIDQWGTTNGGPVLLPEGVLKLTAGVTWRKFTRLSGSANSSIDATGIATGIALQGATANDGAVLENFRMIGPPANTGVSSMFDGAVAIDVGAGALNGIIRNVLVEGFSNQLRLEGVQEWLVEHSRFTGPRNKNIIVRANSINVRFLVCQAQHAGWLDEPTFEDACYWIGTYNGVSPENVIIDSPLTDESVNSTMGHPKRTIFFKAGRLHQLINGSVYVSNNSIGVTVGAACEDVTLDNMRVKSYIAAAEDRVAALMIEVQPGALRTKLRNVVTEPHPSGGDIDDQGTDTTFENVNGEYRLVGDQSFAKAGKGRKMQGGTNAKVGTATFVAGSVTVANTSVKALADQLVLVTVQAAGGTLGMPYVASRVVGTSITFTSTSASDTSTIAYELVDLTPSFKPSDISGLAGWFKADAITGLADSDPVSSWPNSGTGAAAVQATTADKPTYRTAVHSGLPAVYFDGATDRLEVDSLAITTRCTVIGVVRNLSQAAHQVLVGRHSSTDPDSAVGQLWTRYVGGGNLHSFSAKTDAGAEGLTLDTVARFGATKLVTARQYRNPDDNTFTTVLRVNGTEVFTSSGLAGTITTNQTTIGGARANGAFSSAWKGYVHELLVWPDKTLSNSEIVRVEAYLTTKWNLDATGDIVHLDFSALSAGAIASHPDLSKEANTAAQSTSGYRPVAVAAAQNGLSVARFTPANDHHLRVDGAQIGFGWTVVAVAKHNSQAQAGDIFGSRSSTSDWPWQKVGFNGSNQMHTHTRLDANAGEATVQANAGTDWRVYIWVRDGNYISLYRDDILLTTVQHGGFNGSVTTDRAFIGASSDIAGTISNEFDGDIGQIRVIEHPLNATERAAVVAAMRTKWATTPFAPKDISGLLLDLDFSAVPAGAIASHSDLSGNGNTATQGTGANQPIGVAAVQNGLNIARFDGVTDHLRADTVAMGTAWHVFAVMNKTTQAGSRDIVSARRASTNVPVQTCGFVATDLQNIVHRSDGNVLTNVGEATATGVGTFGLYGWSRSGDSLYVERNNIERATATQTLGATTLDRFIIGATLNAVNTVLEAAAVDIGRLLIYNVRLSTDDRLTLYNYLKTIWNLP